MELKPRCSFWGIAINLCVDGMRGPDGIETKKTISEGIQRKSVWMGCGVQMELKLRTQAHARSRQSRVDGMRGPDGIETPPTHCTPTS